MGKVVDTPEDWKNGVILATDRMFSNTDALFVEYHDCLHLTGFIILKALQENCKDIFGINFDEISVLDLKSLLLWYMNRRNKNFLRDLAPDMAGYVLDDYMADQLKANELYDIPFSSLVENIVSHSLEIGFVKKLYVYAEEDCEGIKKDVERMFPDQEVTVLSGELNHALEDIPRDTTYIFSDFEKVITLAECGHLDGAALLLISNYGYNYLGQTDSEMRTIVDFEYLSKQHKFHMGYLNICE